MRALAVAMLLITFAPTLQTPDVGIELPPTNGVFDYQLGGGYDTLTDGTAIDIVVRDSSDQPLQDAYNICYINGFQPQPDELGGWSALQPDVLLRDAAGHPINDPNWPDEYILDPTTAAQRAAILDHMTPDFARCADAGYEAIDLDNLDTFQRFPSLDPDGAMALARAYIDLAHHHGLAIAQKNTPDLASSVLEATGDPGAVPHFDFAIAEDCSVYSECALYAGTFGDHVLQVEYPDGLAEADLTFAQVCDSDDRAPLTILRDRDLTTPASPDYVYARCD